MSKWMKARLSTHLACATLVLACADAPSGIGDRASALGESGDSLSTLDEFATSVAVPGEPDKYLVEGDMLLSYDALTLYYEARVLGVPDDGTVEKSIVVTVNDSSTGTTFDATRANAMNLRYCLTGGWGGSEASQASVQAALDAASSAWSGVSRVRFVHVTAQDGAGCTQAIVGSAVDFVVKPNVGNPNSAYAWWAYATVSELAVGTNMAYVAAMEHELGHVLGLDHEQYHDSSGLGCSPPGYTAPANPNQSWGDQRELTAYDNTSIMHYYNGSGTAVCAGGTPATQRISGLDGIGVRSLYGSPGWWGGWIGSHVVLHLL